MTTIRDIDFAETCSCGARYAITTTHYAREQVMAEARDWRLSHQHTMPRPAVVRVPRGAPRVSIRRLAGRKSQDSGTTS